MKKHLLIVEDENLIMFTLTSGLQSDSLQVTSAANGTKALDTISAFPHFDLYIVDLSLPDMAGEKLVREIRKDQPQAKVIILTGKYLDKQAMLDSMEDADLLEPFYFAPKPFIIEDLQELVFQALFT